MDLKQFIAKTNKFAEDVVEFEEIIQYLHKSLGPIGVKFTYENIRLIDDRDITRVILSARDSSKFFNKPLVGQCGGTIIGFSKHESHWKCELLARPPNHFSNRHKFINMKEYDVYKAEDGTTITLYWINDSWILSTKNGYDVGDLEWRGAKYKDVFMEAMLATMPDFQLESLDKSVSYTVGFCHPTHHPFRSECRAWFIFAYNIHTHTLAENLGLPIQELVQCDDYNELIYNAEAAYKIYSRRGDINFGYVLRHKSKYRTYKPDVFIESSLLSNIRRVLYQQSFIKDVNRRRDVKKLFSHIEYAVWRSYLDINKRRLLPVLFPQYNNMLEGFDQIIHCAVRNICNGEPKSELETQLNDYVYKRLRLYKKTPLTADVVNDLITSPSTIDIYIKNLYDF